MMKKLLLLMAIILASSVAAFADVYSDVIWTPSNTKNFTDDQGVTFEISGDASFSNNTFQIAKDKVASITWTAPEGYNLTITSISLQGQSAGSEYGAEVWSNVNKDRQIVLNSSSTTTDVVDAKYLGNGSTELTIRSKNRSLVGNTTQLSKITFGYELVSKAAPNVIVENAVITNQWNSTLLFSDYITLENNPSNVTVGASSDSNVASWNGSNFVLGHKTGTASFTVSADGVEDRTFTITANQEFYNYAANIIGGETALAGTHNQSEAEAVISTFRANKIASVANGDNVTYMLDNADFQYAADWKYGWIGANDETHTGDIGWLGSEGDPMNGYQKYAEGENVYARMYRGNYLANQYTLKSGNVYQDVRLVSGYYRVSADAKCNSNDDNVKLTGTLYAKDGEDIIGKFDKSCAKNSGFTNVTAAFAVASEKIITIGYSHNESKNSSQKEVAVDNFTLTYICSKAIYDAYMEQYGRAEGIKDNAYLQTATSNALKAAIKDINTLTDAADIVAKTAVLKDACDKAKAEITWCTENNPAQVYINNVYVYAGVNRELGRGANWGTRAVVAEDGLTVKVTTATNGIANLTFTKDNKKLFETTDHYIYTDYNNSGSYDFYLVGDEENGYKIVLAGDRTKALGIIENENWNANGESGTADVVMPVAVADATVWHFAADKSKLSVKAERYGTFCAPYDVTLPRGVIAYSAEVDGSTVILTELTDNTAVPANTPVIIKNNNNEAVSGVYYGEAATTPTATAGPLVGVFSEITVPVGNYVLQTKGDVQKFYKVGETTQPKMAKNKAYLHIDNQARELSLGGEETAIEAIEALMENKAEIYDLNGRRLNNLQKGINIVNGKKFIVK